MSDDVLRTIDEVMAANAVRFHPFGPPREAPKSDDPWVKAHAVAFAGPPEHWPGPGCLCSTCEALRVRMVPDAGPFGHETSECKYFRGMTVDLLTKMPHMTGRESEIWDTYIDRYLNARLNAAAEPPTEGTTS